jgi:hypothetical protein
VNAPAYWTPTVTYQAPCPRCRADCTWTDHITQTEIDGQPLYLTRSDGGNCPCSEEAAA